MSKIRILPEQLANQIAAGEVVERPASVVKELVENSIDAGSDRIIIEIQGSGTRQIRIIDNGSGMDEDDILLSLERHGTSKITTEEDLGAIDTLGFRGEAIPSIGSVSQLTITSRTADSDLGTQVHLHYGKLTKVHETGAASGTTTEVRNLFGNTPARRKFLRTARTELSHIEEVIKNYALACPDITFILTIDGRETLHLDNTFSLEQRLGTILRYRGSFIPVQSHSGAGRERRVSGFLIPPEQVTVGPARLRTFVNGRAVRDRMIIHAVTEGLRGFLMKGKNPSGLIILDLPPQEIDVNVHPAKHEVRFRQARDVHTLIANSVAAAMQEHQKTVRTTIFGRDSQTEPSPVPMDNWTQGAMQSRQPNIEPEKQPPQKNWPVNRSSSPYQQQKPAQHIPTVLSEPEAFNESGNADGNEENEAIASPGKSQDHSTTMFNETSPIQRSQPPLDPRDDTRDSSEINHNLLIIGQYDDLYIFCKTPQGLLVIDQHAAHERLLYEKLRKQYLGGSIARQTLMFPETIDLSPYQIQLVEKYSEEIDKVGFTLREFGGSTYIISAIPAITKSMNVKDLFFDTLERFGSENNRRGTDAGGFIDNILATMACKAAVKAGTELSNTEIKALLDEMARADLFSHCPHGRPVVKQFNKEDIKKWFYRT